MKKIFRISKLLIPALALFMWSRSQAQQDPLYAQYLNNPFVLNPAYAGLTNNLSTALTYRQQWAGFTGSPTTVNLYGHVSLLNNTMGVGAMIVQDKIGVTSTTEFSAAYSYRLKIDRKGTTFAFGLQAGMQNFQMDNSQLNPQNKTDPLFQGLISETHPSVGAGIILTGDKFFLGLSVPRMLKSSLSVDGVQANLYSQHYYFMGSYLFFLSQHLRLKPSVLMKYVAGAPASLDLNAALVIHERYQVGALVRDFGTYGAFLQALIGDKVRFGYVFEVPSGDQAGGSPYFTHELTLGVRMNVLKFHSNEGVLSF